MNTLLAYLDTWLAPSQFSPHGFCLWWEPGLIWLHAGSDVAITLAYLSIPLAMLAVLRQRRDWRYPGLIILFASFILLCGLTHAIGLATLWYPAYWLEGAVKLATAFVSVATAILLWPLIPRLVAIPSADALQAANSRLAQEAAEKDRLVRDLRRREADLRSLTEALEERVAERTRRLAEAHDRFARQLAELPAVVYGGKVDAEGVLSLDTVSESFTRITGWTPDLILPGFDWRLLQDEEAAARRGAFMRGAVQGGAMTSEYRLRRADGSWIWVRDHVGVVSLLPGGAAEVIGYVADISAERDVQAKAEANGRLAVLGEMATGLAHELNQPLSVMLLASDNARRALESHGQAAIPGVLQRLDRIANQAARARSIVDHLRIFGRAEAAEPRAIVLADAVAGALVLTGGAIRSAGIQLDVAVPPTLPAIVAALVPLEQTIVNLLVNARDAIAGQGVARQEQGRITLVGASDGDAVTFTVADNGGGIPEAVLQRVFEPFFTTKEVGKGTGLGLSIAYSTMRAFGGSITASSVGDGTVFELRFAIAPSQDSAATA